MIVIDGISDLAFLPARDGYSAEVSTKLAADIVQDELVQNGITGSSVSKIEDFLSGKLIGPPMSKRLEPPVIDVWGQPLHATQREFMFKNKPVDFGIYSYGPDGKSEEEGNDIDDISSWADCDNEYWRGVNRRVATRIWTRRLGASSAVGFTTFFLSLLSRKLRSGSDR